MIDSSAWTGRKTFKKPYLNEWADLIDAAIYDHSKILSFFFPRQWLANLGDELEEMSEYTYEYRQYGAPSQYNYGPTDTELELRKVKAQLDAELSKVRCPDCEGLGYHRSDGPAHYTHFDCTTCNGQGRI